MVNVSLDLMLGHAIVNQPKFILLDKPTRALHSQISQEIMNIFAEPNGSEHSDGYHALEVT